VIYRGFYIGRGAFHGTTDDRLDRWYAWRADGPINRCGTGFLTRREAKTAVDVLRDMLDGEQP
jgi:hypothetical protein